MIRCAAAADAPRLSQIIQRSEQSVTHPILRKLYGRQRRAVRSDAGQMNGWTGSNHIYVYDDDGTVKGLIAWEQTEPVCEKKNAEVCCYSDLCCYEKFASCSVEILGIYVDPDYRGEGIGKRMMESFLKNMQYQDVRCADIWVLEDDSECSDFFSNFGFSRTTDERVIADGLKFVKYIHQYY